MSKITGKVAEALNRQVNGELYSGYLYLSMSAWCESQGLRGSAKWLRKQANEEKAHAMKFFDFVNTRGGVVVLDAVAKPSSSWSGLLEVFSQASEHEQAVTKIIGSLVDLARQEGDKATESFLQWFVDEQVEEEATSLEILAKLKMAGDSTAALLFLDAELGRRE